MPRPKFDVPEGQYAVSPSQVQTFEQCDRKWWASSILKMPSQSKDYFAFGTIFDQVMRRYYSADRQGRDPKTGLIIDLFPPGWDTNTEKGRSYTLTPAEVVRVKHWVRRATEKGILSYDGFVANGVAYSRKLIDGAWIVGEIDLLMEDGIQDFKTAKNSKYLKREGPDKPIDTPYLRGDKSSPNCVGHDTQMLTYACEWFERNEADWICKVGHRQFIKDAEDTDGVYMVTAEISRRRADQHWRYLQDTAAAMLKLRNVPEADWFKVGGPKVPDACSAYGGCAMLGICGKTETPDQYRARVNYLQNTTAKPPVALPAATLLPAPRTSSGNQMTNNIFAKRNGTPSAAPAPMATAPLATAPMATPAFTPATAPAAMQAAIAPAPQPTPILSALTIAPWAAPKNAQGMSCGGCLGTGINKNQQPCRVCDSIAAKTGQPTSNDFVLFHDANGMLGWEAKAGAPSERLNAQLSAPPVPPMGGSTPPIVESSVTANAGPIINAPVAPIATSEAIPSTPKRARGRPPGAKNKGTLVTAPVDNTPVYNEGASGNGQPFADEASAPTPIAAPTKTPTAGFIILIDAAFMSCPNRPTVTGASLLEKYGTLLANSQGFESYFAMDTWKRRDAMRQSAALIASELGSIGIVSFGSDPDTKNLVESLVPYAALVIQGVK